MGFLTPWVEAMRVCNLIVCSVVFAQTFVVNTGCFQLGPLFLKKGTFSMLRVVFPVCRMGFPRFYMSKIQLVVRRRNAVKLSTVVVLEDWRDLCSTMNGTKVIILLWLICIVVVACLVLLCAFGLCSTHLVSLFCLAGMTEVPTGAVCLSSRQILAYGKAAVRLERSQSRVEEKSLSRHKFFLYTVIACLFDCSLDCVWSFVFVALCSVLCLSVTLFGVRLLFFFVLFRYERSRAIVEVKRHSAASGFRATR